MLKLKIKPTTRHSLLSVSENVESILPTQMGFSEKTKILEDAPLRITTSTFPTVSSTECFVCGNRVLPNVAVRLPNGMVRHFDCSIADKPELWQLKLAKTNTFISQLASTFLSLSGETEVSLMRKNDLAKQILDIVGKGITLKELKNQTKDNWTEYYSVLKFLLKKQLIVQSGTGSKSMLRCA